MRQIHSSFPVGRAVYLNGSHEWEKTIFMQEKQEIILCYKLNALQSKHPLKNSMIDNYVWFYDCRSPLFWLYTIHWSSCHPPTFQWQNNFYRARGTLRSFFYLIIYKMDDEYQYFIFNWILFFLQKNPMIKW